MTDDETVRQHVLTHIAHEHVRRAAGLLQNAMELLDQVDTPETDQLSELLGHVYHQLVGVRNQLAEHVADNINSYGPKEE